ncbi:MAG TPA: FecR/PupR family sigma factor regulator, partial [Caulobacter sp.]|nr:FecR/PupR family sigma factor regulator [Caulobacter sp.]
MTESVPHDPIQQAAIDWFAKLQGEPALEDWTTFQAWLEADPAHAAAYDRVEAMWIELDDVPANDVETAPTAEARLAANVVPLRSRLQAGTRRGLLAG